MDTISKYNCPRHKDNKSLNLKL